MSRVARALGRISPQSSPRTSPKTSRGSRGQDSSGQSSSGQSSSGVDSHAGEYGELIERLFHDSATVAIIGSGCGESAMDVCEEIAAELSGMGKRVILVSVHRLLQSSPEALSEDTVFMPGCAPNVWRWPSFFGRQIESFKPRIPADGESWLDSLRRNFDAVLLDCPALETPPGVAAVAAMADAAVLAVEAARTTKHQMLRDQRALESSGAKLAGCILITAR